MASLYARVFEISSEPNQQFTKVCSFGQTGFDRSGKIF